MRIQAGVRALVAALLLLGGLEAGAAGSSDELGGHAEVRVSVDYEKGISVWPESISVMYAEAGHRKSTREYRVRWIVSGNELQPGHRVVLRPKSGTPNRDILRSELWLDVPFGSDGELSVSSGFPAEPAWEGYVDPVSHAVVLGSDYEARMNDILSEAGRGSSALYPPDREVLAATFGGQVALAAQWIYEVFVVDGDGREVLYLDPTMVIKECP